jgi:hypothetical protein
MCDVPNSKRPRETLSNGGSLNEVEEDLKGAKKMAAVRV